MSDNLGNNLVYFLLGAATGAAIALLYAPQEGEATRRMIGEKASEYKDKATDLTSNITQTARDQVSKVQDKVQDLRNRGQQVAHDGIDNAAGKAHSAVDSVS
jgi:gas vesicle protein